MVFMTSLANQRYILQISKNKSEDALYYLGILFLYVIEIIMELPQSYRHIHSNLITHNLT